MTDHDRGKVRPRWDFQFPILRTADAVKALRRTADELDLAAARLLVTARRHIGTANRLRDKADRLEGEKR